MASTLEKEEIRARYQNSDLSEVLVGDMRRWEQTFDVDGGKQDSEKADALKRILLLFGGSGMQVSGSKIVDGRVVEASTEVSQNNIPVAEYLSGHMGRGYASLPSGMGGEVLDWVSGKTKETPGVVYPRFAATHAGKVDKVGQVEEKKLGVAEAAWGGFTSMVSSFFGSSTPRLHNGFDVAMGGKGNSYEHVDGATIKDDGSSGHVYMNVNTGKHGDSIGFGLEGTAPGAHGPLGAHSITGAADDFSALEGPKAAISVNSTGSNCLSEIRAFLDSSAKTEGPAAEAAKKLQKHCDAVDAHAQKPWYRRWFSSPGSDAMNKKEFKHTCEDAGVPFVDGGKKMLTSFGRQSAEAGMVVQGNYGGLTMSFSDPEKLAGIMGVDVSKVPDEVIYFKPQVSKDSFLAQGTIYEGIATKPVLRDNPQFSHETSVAVGTMYNVASKNPELAPAISQTLGLMTKENMATLGININHFDAKTDIDTMTETLTNASPEMLDELGVSDVGTVLDNLQVMQAVSERATERFDSKEQYQEVQKEAEEAFASIVEERTAIVEPETAHIATVTAESVPEAPEIDMARHNSGTISLVDAEEERGLDDLEPVMKGRDGTTISREELGLEGVFSSITEGIPVESAPATERSASMPDHKSSDMKAAMSEVREVMEALKGNVQERVNIIEGRKKSTTHDLSRGVTAGKDDGGRF